MNKQYYYLNEQNEQLGPLDESLLIKGYQTGQYAASTHVWCEGMDSWQSLASVMSSLGIEITAHEQSSESPAVSKVREKEFKRSREQPIHIQKKASAARKILRRSNRQRVPQRKTKKRTYYVRVPSSNEVYQVSEEELRQLYLGGKCHRQTYVWTEGMNTWRPLEQVAATKLTMNTAKEKFQAFLLKYPNLKPIGIIAFVAICTFGLIYHADQNDIAEIASSSRGVEDTDSTERVYQEASSPQEDYYYSSSNSPAPRNPSIYESSSYTQTGRTTSNQLHGKYSSMVREPDPRQVPIQAPFSPSDPFNYTPWGYLNK